MTYFGRDEIRITRTTFIYLVLFVNLHGFTTYNLATENHFAGRGLCIACNADAAFCERLVSNLYDEIATRYKRVSNQINKCTALQAMHSPLPAKWFSVARLYVVNPCKLTNKTK